MDYPFSRFYDFNRPLDEAWEVIPGPDWNFETAPGSARFVNAGNGTAQIFIRPCCLYDDTFELQLQREAPRAGVLRFGFAGFEYITLELDLTRGELEVHTHEYHKLQPRYKGRCRTDFSNIKLLREKDHLPGLPYEGSAIRLLLDDELAASVGEIDFLPECIATIGLKGPAEITLQSVSFYGSTRPRPEYIHVGAWQSAKETTAENVNALLEGARRAAEVGVELLLTPETSLTGLRPEDPELSNPELIQSELRRFQESYAGISNAPYTLIGYPEWIPGEEVEGATLDQVKVNTHRFVRPDGSLGPRMMKVHSCETGMWHGRHYNLQRVKGVEIAVGICHDIRYPDVWSTGVMGGARLCFHPSANGIPNGKSSGRKIAAVLEACRQLNRGLDAWWVGAGTVGPSVIISPHSKAAKYSETIVATPPDLSSESTTDPDFCPMNDVLAHARIRLWDATGSFPMRVLRGGRRQFEAWSRLVPEIRDV